MSKETLEWLNSMTLIGFTEKRGNAWHYAAAFQGDEPNHYPGAIPIEDVRRRLFDWKAVSEPLFIGDGQGGYTEIPGRQAILADDNRDLLGIFSDGYQPHQYQQWLLTNVANILGDGYLGIGSAGLLRNRGQAWVSVEIPDSIKTVQGVVFRPNLVACTSFDGSLATTYKATSTIVVCDNTLQAGLQSAGGVFRVRHTKNSQARIADAREALEIVHTIAEDFEAEVARLTAIEVTRKQFAQITDKLVPLTDDKGEALTGRGLTLSEKKRTEIFRLYDHDDRVAPWAGTAFGVLQAWNTHMHHFGNVRGASRVQRNREAILSGKFANEDQRVLAAVRQVTAA